ncbi:hypothetical protein [Aureimonas sp. ME7]|uniref:hypothetical protein n=1 Tax=Aureimonas sp. ME7 TaxID=2744252 RepID=UPI0015F59F92|nr:hypothetical protein [Aureimonas sp. ME7]
MQALRIALGLLGLVAVFFLVLPAEPTLLAGSGSQPNETSVAAIGIEDVPFSPDMSEEAPSAPVRTIIPAPGGPTRLTRLPPVSSGAATPPVAVEPDGTGDTAEAAPPPPELPIVSATATPPEPADPALRLFSRPIAVDARTLKAGDMTLRVAGVEPIAPDVRCVDGAQAWPCATRARTALRGWLRGRSVECRVPSGEEEARDITVPCRLGQEDVARWLVTNGWAHAEPGSAYEDAERAAREARRGIWAYDISNEATRSGG